MNVVTEVLPLRTCSTCANWYVSNATEDKPDGVITALCCIKNERKSGGEKCGGWKVKARDTLNTDRRNHGEQA